MQLIDPVSQTATMSRLSDTYHTSAPAQLGHEGKLWVYEILIHETTLISVSTLVISLEQVLM